MVWRFENKYLILKMISEHYIFSETGTSTSTYQCTLSLNVTPLAMLILQCGHTYHTYLHDEISSTFVINCND